MINRKKILVTGSSGLIGGEVVQYFSNEGYRIIGIDNNQREQFFGQNGSNRENQNRLATSCKGYVHHEIDIRDRARILALIKEIRPDSIIHTAAQPSHDLAARIPFEDFEINAVGTLNILEGVRRYCPESPFIHLSTNKVYGDLPNKLPIIEKKTRWDFSVSPWLGGIPETFSIDQSKHSLFGASKLAADILVQEYGNYFGIPSCSLRGGCLTGPYHAGVELHGFLNYLIKCNLLGTTYTVYGYKGKQVRDNIHSHDVATFIHEFLKSPRVGEVYNLGGGKQNSVSLIEAFDMIEQISGKKMITNYSDANREGDHIVYYSDLGKIRKHFPNWMITKSLNDIFSEIHEQCRNKL
jgi:CDP-paratose 2-epimerase